jgi:hypothetical protein
MSILEEVKAKIKAGEINEAMSMAMSEVMKLEIITSLSDVNEKLSSPHLCTVIDLLENEIDYQISEELISNDLYEQIKQIHHQQVQQGNERILKNVESLQKMFSMLNYTCSDLLGS